MKPRLLLPGSRVMRPAGWFVIVLLSSMATHAARPLGIDTSHWNGSINWTNVYNAGKVFVFTKASESTYFIDNTLVTNAPRAKAAGLLLGVYHFARPLVNTGAAGATNEANWFVSVAGQYMTNGHLRPVLDLETGAEQGAAALSVWANAFCNRVKQLTGASPIIYCNVNYAQNYLNSSVTNWALWIAQWPANPDPENGNPSGDGVWPTWNFWQYSDSGSVPGVQSANCDLNVFKGTYAELVANFVTGGAAGNPPAITQQPTHQKSVFGGTVSFYVGATGDGTLGYRWQKNNTNLNNGGHYSGVFTPLLTVANCDSNDVANYRCVVTNSFGTTNSSAASLSLVTNDLGLSLITVPLASGHTSNEARAITPDGKYIVGFNGASSTGGTNGFLYNVIHQTLRTGILATDNTGSRAASLFGVAYRAVAGATELVLDGFSAGWHANYMTTNDGVTWGTIRRDTSVGSAVKLPMANSLAGTAADRLFSTWWDENSSDWQLYVGRYSNAWPASVQWDKKGIPQTIPAGTHGVSTNGRVAGWRFNPKANYIMDWNGAGTPAVWFLPGLSGNTNGEAFAINADGTVIFGQSPVTGGRPGSWGYKAVVTTNIPGVLQSIAELPNFPDTVGTSGSAAVPYGCTPDGKHAVGMSFRGLEKAVLWDTSDASPANWTVTDLTEYAAAKGVLGSFTRLSRAYSVGRNGAGNLVITGVGDFNSGGTFTRAFVLTLAAAPAPNPRITSVVGAGTTSVTVTWTNTVVGTNYVLQYNTNLSTTNWTSLAPVNAAGPTASKMDNPPAGDPRRYYRVRIQ